MYVPASQLTHRIPGEPTAKHKFNDTSFHVKAVFLQLIIYLLLSMQAFYVKAGFLQLFIFLLLSMRHTLRRGNYMEVIDFY